MKLLKNKPLLKYFGFRSSIYSHVVYIITGSFIVLFILFNLVFRTVYGNFFNSNIRQSGENIASLVEGSLYYSMLENNEAMLQQTLDIISTMPGINEVNMYNKNDSLAYSSLSTELENRGNPNCKECHFDMDDMFPTMDIAYRIIDANPESKSFHSGDNSRHVLIRKLILNESSCYTANCHAHNKEDVVLGSLIIKLPLDELDSFVDKSSRDFIILATLIIILLVTILLIFTRKKIKDPLNSIVRASKAVSEGDNSIRLEIQPKLLDDMLQVSLAFNNMLENIETTSKELQNWSNQLEYKVQKKSEELSEAQNELMHVERIASLGKLSSSVAHEINNPLSGILVYTKLIYKKLNTPDFQHPKKDSIIKHLEYIENETKRCGDIVKGLLDFSRKDQNDFKVCSLHELLKATCDLMTHSIKIAEINFINDFKASSDDIYCSPNQIKQACVALLVNASEAIQDKGEIIIRTSNSTKDNIYLEISDNGSGISPQDLPHVFEPFFSTKHDVRGIGLGLSIVHGIVENHKGQIEVDSEPGTGTTITITFPLNKN